jgi:serine/threonine protein kinase
MDRRYVRLDPQKLDYLRLKKGWGVEELFALVDGLAVDPVDGKPAGLDKRTVKAVLNGESTFVRTARILARFLGAENLVAVLHPELLRELGTPSTWENPLEFFSTVGEWDVVEPVEEEQQTSNSLRYDVWKLRHRHVAERFGRAKCYDLSQLSTKDRTRLKTHLTRHSEVCDRIGAHPNIAKNRSAAEWEYGALWWVIDEWTNGEKLSALLESNRLSATDVPAVMLQIAEGLQALHKADVVRRELSPRFVLIGADMSVVLTDFELAKLLEGAPTVSPKKGWPDDGYRAIEVEGDAPIDVRVDIYSWGRILTHAVAGKLPAKGKEADALTEAKLPPAVRRLALSCVALARSDRPGSIEQVLAGIRKWA